MHAIDAQPVESTADGDRRAAEYGDDLPVYLASMTQSWMTGCGQKQFACDEPRERANHQRLLRGTVSVLRE